MKLTYAQLVDEIRRLPLEDREELQQLIAHDIIEARRAEIERNAIEAVQEWQSGERKPTDDIDELLRRLKSA